MEGKDLQSVPDVVVHFGNLCQPLFSELLPFDVDKTNPNIKKPGNDPGHEVCNEQ